MSLWLIIGIVAVAAGLAVLIAWLRQAPPATVETDPHPHRRVNKVDPAQTFPVPCDQPCTGSPSTTTAGTDAAAGKVFVRHARKHCNCVGFTLGRGDWQIDTTEVPAILADNYDSVPEGGVEVCSVIVWSTEAGVDHIGLVIEVEDGKVKVVRSKSTTSHFVYDHPSVYGKFGVGQVYVRKSLNALPPAARQAYEDAKKDWEDIDDKSSELAHDAAERMCQARNALRGT